VKGGAESGAVVVLKAVQLGAASGRPEMTPTQEGLENQTSRHPLTPADIFCTSDQLAKVGLEPTHLAVLDFESSASAVPPLGRVHPE
jgi:hypothetical protein